MVCIYVYGGCAAAAVVCLSATLELYDDQVY